MDVTESELYGAVMVNENGDIKAYCGEDNGWVLIKNILDESEDKNMTTNTITNAASVSLTNTTSDLLKTYVTDNPYCDFDRKITNTTHTNTNYHMNRNTVSSLINGYDITNINVIKENKVVEIAFRDGKKEKMVCHEEDTFDLRKCCFIAIAKHLYKKDYTYEGIEYMAEHLMYQKKYVKIVDKAMKEYQRTEDEKVKKIHKEEEEKIIRDRQKARRLRQKERRRERIEAERNAALKDEREEMISIIADAINKAKADRKHS